VLKVSSVTLAQQFDANKVAALGCYKDRIVQTSGTATNVSQVLGSYFVALRPGGDYSGFTSMQCFVSGPDAVMSVVNGQPVTVRHRVDDQTLGVIAIKDSRIAASSTSAHTGWCPPQDRQLRHNDGAADLVLTADRSRAAGAGPPSR